MIFSSSQGSIYEADIFDIYRHSKSYPNSAYYLNGPSILSRVVYDNRSDKPKSKTPIIDFIVEWEDRPFWKILALY